MNIPNILSLLRIIMVPFFAHFYMRGRLLQAMAVLLLCGASDVLDGAIARRCNMVTELGKALDPVADKLLQTAMMLCAAVNTPLVWLLLAVHILRELTLSALSLYVLHSTGRVYAAKWYGKACSAFIYTVLICLLAFPGIPQAEAYAAVLFCVAAVGLCLILYILSFMNVLEQYQAEG